MNKIKPYLLLAAAGIFVIGTNIVGIIFGREICYTGIYSLILAAVFGLILVCNIAGTVLLAKRIQKKTFVDAEKELLARHQDVKEDIRRQAKKLKIFQKILAGYLAGLMILAVLLAFFAGASGTAAGYGVISIYVLYALTYHQVVLKIKFDDTGYSNKEDYPFLYALAERAMREYGLKGTVRIFILAECNAGITKIGNIYSLQLGAYLLHLMNEEELYSVLLHEFAHMADPYIKEQITPSWLKRIIGGYSTFDAKCAYLLMMFPIEFYQYEAGIYNMTASETIEQRADQNAGKRAGAHIYAAAMAKLSMGELFEDEYLLHVPTPDFASEEPEKDTASAYCRAFDQAFEKRKEKWLWILKNQLPFLMQSHPTFKERWEALGFPEFSIVMTEKKGAYRDDCQKVFEYADRKIYEAFAENYEEHRKNNYLNQLEIVKKWESEGEPIDRTDIATVIQALHLSGCYERAEDICEKVIENTDNVYMTAFPLFYKGVRRLLHYEKEGIDLIYRAIELNHNYIDEGMDMIGEFCSRMALKKEQEEYRQKVAEMRQSQIDVYDRGGDISKSDHLEAEHFPDDRLETILAVMKKAGEGKIEAIYLVRKVVSSDAFFSMFIVKWMTDAEADRIETGMEQIFQCLDTWPDGWPYSLLVSDEKMESIVKRIEGSCVYAADGGHDEI